MEHPASQEHQEFQVQVDHLDHRVSLELQEPADFLEPLE